MKSQSARAGVELLARAAMHRHHADAGTPRRCAPGAAHSGWHGPSPCASSASPAPAPRAPSPSRMRAAAASSRISAEPAICPTATFFTGQPKLMSIRSAPRSDRDARRLGHRRRVAAGQLHGRRPPGSDPPRPCAACCGSPAPSPRTRSSPTPPSRPPAARASRRNGRSVTPDIGARITGVSMRTPPPRSIGASRGLRQWHGRSLDIRSNAGGRVAHDLGNYRPDHVFRNLRVTDRLFLPLG